MMFWAIIQEELEKVGCRLNEALDRESSMADQAKQLEDHMRTKRFFFVEFVL